jgi:hypothetical protein
MNHERITITIDRASAFVVVDALNCFSDCMEGNYDTIFDVWTPSNEEGVSAYMKSCGDMGQEVAHRLRQEIDRSMKCDPDVQDFIHRMKILKKRGEDARDPR